MFWHLLPLFPFSSSPLLFRFGFGLQWRLQSLVSGLGLGFGFGGQNYIHVLRFCIMERGMACRSGFWDLICVNV